MECGKEIRTERLLLRRWRAEDREPFFRLNADPDVLRYFPNTLTREESDAIADRIEAHFEEHGYGPWAVEVPGETPFAGFVGLMVVPPELPFAPAVEVGWRLAREQWGRGYASEAARAAVRYGFECLGLTEIVSFTVPENARSRRVMEAIGMTRIAADDFDNPRVSEGHPLRRHVLYRIHPEGFERAAGNTSIREES